ncbi:aliphatic sulfonate ABC transporter substrate-binding protein [Hymenobacter nivis]|uniref:Putative aliphatic sulfonates-binding protein n=1 Tax=Hymenobacter nivis TaxID=1850093 RepID=A0A2Z3GQX4_9BACT|nr:aliphatic sulfonate ABC transporter substrate-binding protein [Hymenobacter nivis]AWM33706.1 aliphatic sulfonates ABC transporter substrate-binding protein [Hymenobacter nivis]
MSFLFLSARRGPQVLLCVALALGGLLTGCGSGSNSAGTAAAPETVRLDYAYYNPLSLVLKQQGWLEKDLAKQNVKVEWVLSQGSNKALEFLNGSSLDFGSAAGAAALVARANGNPLKAVYIFSKPEWTALVVGPKSTITTVAGLRGKRVAATKGTDPYIFLLRALDQAGMSEKDIELIPLQHPDGRAALEKGDVDAWAGLDPHMAKAELESGARLLYRNPEFNSYGVLNVREAFAKDHPALVGAVLRAYEQARAWARQHPAELQQTLATAAKLSPAVAAKQLARTDFAVNGFGAPQLATIAAAGDVLKKTGTIEAGVDVAQTLKALVDPQFVNKLPAAPVAAR